MGELLKEEKLLPDLIISSSAKRARRTAECVSEYSAYRGETRVTGELYEASAADLVRVIGATADSVDRLLVVGHNPGLEELLELLTAAYTPLSTAALAQVELQSSNWRHFGERSSGRLIAVWQPRELP